MDLISCEKCGVVLDQSKLRFPENIRDADGCIDERKASWDGDDYIAKVFCPMCGADILKEGRE